MINLYKIGIRALIVIVLSLTLVENSFSKIGPGSQKKLSRKTISRNPSTCSGDVSLTTQAEVDAFPSVHGCTEITGRLTISGTDITNIDSLYAITKVGELIIIGNGNLTNLNGLSHLQVVTATCSSIGCGGTNMGFTISNNALLSDISALSSLTKIEPDLVISSNPKMANLQGLNNVVSIGGRLWIEDNATLGNLNDLASLTSIGFYQLGINNNPSLTSLEGLSLITSIPGSLYINNNTSLPNLHGLESLTQLNGGGGASLTISNNASLINIDALSSLHSIHGSGASGGLTVSNNPVLANLNGLQSLTEILGIYLATLEITNNASLHEVDGLSSLDTLSGFNLRVTVNNNSLLGNANGLSSIGLSTPRPTIIVNNNPALTESCGLYGIVSYANHNPGGYVDVSGNGAGCTKTEILANGPCTQGSSTETSSMIFSAVTDTTMTVSFTPASGNPDGYITLIQAFGSPNPDDAPVDGTVYQPGGTIGSSTIVINVGPERSLDIVYLIPDVEYYFDVFPYKISSGYYNYMTDNLLEGIQRTSSSGITGSSSARMRSSQGSKSSGYSEHPSGNDYVHPFPNPFSEKVTIPFTTKNQDTFVQIVIYDLLGKRIANVASQNFDPGYHEAKWEGIDIMGSRVSQGLYIYSIKTNETNREMQGMLVAK